MRAVSEHESTATTSTGSAPSSDLPGTAADLDDVTSAGVGYVSFEMQADMYALEMDRVQEIIRMPALVRVPLGPAALEGLANLRGRVLPVVSLRHCCSLPEVAPGEATRVIVIEADGTMLGLVVDRVAAVISVEPDQVESGASVQSTVRSELLAAVIKGEDGVMTTVLDVDRLVLREFALLAERAATTAKAASLAPSAPDEGPDADDSAGTLELVSFAVDGQEYALPIDRVQEIVQAPERLTAVPNAAGRVLGVMDLRGALLPVLSLRSVFGLPRQDLEPHNRIVVVTVERDGSRSLVGVVMDTVREVLRVPLALVDPLPHVVSGGGRRTEVESVCRLDDGTRLVSVLSVECLLDTDVLAAADAAGADPAATDEGNEMSDSDGGEDELFVVFRLGAEEYCVDVDAVQEIIRVPETLVRVPGTADLVEGVVNLRGAVLPVVDLRTALGLDRVARDERQRIVVLIIGGVRTGFVVDSVAEVAKVRRSDLEPAPELAAEQRRVVTRVANIRADERMLLVLEAEELLGPAQPAAVPDSLGTSPAAAA